MARVYPWNYPGVPVPRKHLRGLGEPQQYSEYTTGASGGSSIPSGPYAPPPTVVMMPNNVPPPLGPLTHVNITPLTPVFVPPAPDIIIRRVPSVNVNVKLPGPVASVDVPPSTWADYQRRAASIPWRGDKPEQGAHSVDVLKTLQRRAGQGDPDAAPAAKAFVERLEWQDAQWQARRQQELDTYAEVGRQYRASQEGKVYSELQKKYPDAIITRSIEEYRAAVAANPGKKVVKVPDNSYTGSLPVSLATTFAPKIASAGSERVSDVAAQTTSDLGSGIKNGVDALSTWIGLKTEPVKTQVAARAKGWTERAQELLAPVAASIPSAADIKNSLIQSSLLTQDDVNAAKTRWGNFTTSSWYKLIQRLEGKTQLLKILGNVASATGLVNKIKTDVDYMARYPFLIAAVKRASDPTIMSDDVKDQGPKQDAMMNLAGALNNVITQEAQRQEQEQAQAKEDAKIIRDSGAYQGMNRPAPAVPSSVSVKKDKPQKPQRRYGPESYDLPE